MDLVMIGVIALLFFLLFLLLGVPLAINFFFIGIIATTNILGFGSAIDLLGETLYYGIATPSFAAIPMFVLLGTFAAKGGLAKNAYSAVNNLATGLPGSLGIATCFGCAAFGAVSGSSLATAAVFGRISLPEMERHNYDKRLALGTIAAGGTFAGMIPPSTMFIVYALFTDVSIARLFLAGIVPGILTAIAYSTSIILRVKNKPSLAPQETTEKISFVDRVKPLVKTWPIIILAFIILGGIYSGVFTPTEAGAAGVFAAFIIGFLKGGLRKKETILSSLKESAQTTSMVFLIIVGAMYFSRVLAVTRIPTTLSSYVMSFDLPNFMILLGILFVWFLLGMIIIPMGILPLTLPIFFPVIVRMGYNPIWFGVITMKLIEIAAVTPPVGLNLYSLKGVASKDTTIEDIAIGIWPFVLVDVIMLGFLLAFPKISLFLPNLLLGSG